MNNLKSRLAISLFANLYRGGSTLLIGVLLARFLGSEDYGRLVFLTATSLAIKQLLDLGSSSAFFTFLSQEIKSRKFVFQFLVVFFAKYIVIIFIITKIIPAAWVSTIWLEETRLVVVIAIISVSLQFDFWPIASQLLESQRKTMKVQFLFVIAQMIQIGIIFGLHYFEILNVTNYLGFIGMLWFISAAIAIVLYSPKSSNYHVKRAISVGDYFRYCLPVAPAIFIALTGELYDKWMLQNFGGGNQQAYFAISAQFASISLLLTASFIKIFWKEVAEAMHKGDLHTAITLYSRSRRLIFYCASLVATSCIPWAPQIINFLYGSDYALAATPLVFLMLYSIYQSIGQIDGAFLMASGRTRVGFKMHILLAPLGIFGTFFLLATPNSYLFCLGLGAKGLAIKMVIAQLISVNVIAHLIRKEFCLKPIILNQIQILTFLILLGWIIKIILSAIVDLGNYLFIFGIVLHFLIVILLAILMPRIFSLPVDWVKRAKLMLIN